MYETCEWYVMSIIGKIMGKNISKRSKKKTPQKVTRFQIWKGHVWNVGWGVFRVTQVVPPGPPNYPFPSPIFLILLESSEEVC